VQFSDPKGIGNITAFKFLSQPLFRHHPNTDAVAGGCPIRSGIADVDISRTVLLDAPAVPVGQMPG